jgi:hypothetical protein
MKRRLQPALRSLGACPEARARVGRKGPILAAYWACPDGSWLVWLATKVGVDRRLLAAAVIHCTELAARSMAHAPKAVWQGIEAAKESLQDPGRCSSNFPICSELADIANSGFGRRIRLAAAAKWAVRATGPIFDHAATHAVDYAAECIDGWHVADAVREVIPFETIAAAYAKYEEARA